MSFNSESTSSVAKALIAKSGSKHSYSRKRWDGFTAWQEHLRQTLESLNTAPHAERDRDLRRVVVPG
jgi:hypothetical protein